MNKFFGIAISLVVLFTLSCAGGGSPQQSNSQRQQAVPLWTGDGGRNMSIAILAPQASGLEANQN
jgi:hypothetical protein